MAWLETNKTSVYYLAGFRNSEGKRIRRSTKVRIRGEDKAETIELKRRAQAVADRFELLARGHITNEASIQRTVEDLVEMATGQKAGKPGMREHGKEYLKFAEKNYSPGTYAGAKVAINRFVEHTGDIRVDEIKPDHIEAYLDSRKDAGAAPATQKKERALLSKMFKRAKNSGLIQINPVSLSTPVKNVGQIHRHPFTEDEIKKLLKAAAKTEHAKEWVRLINVARLTGLRLGDCCRLGREHYDKDKNVLNFIDQKTQKTLVIPVASTLKPYFKEEFIAPYFRTLKTISPVSKRFDKLLTAAEIDRMPISREGQKTVNLKSFHSLRHNFISSLTEAGVDPEIRMKLAGHNSVDVHEIYVHHKGAQLAEAIAKLK